METKQLQQLGDRKVNAVFTLTDMPKYFQEYVKAKLHYANDEYVWEAQYSSSNDTEKVFGLEIIKDYNTKFINLIYKARDNRYVGVGLAKLSQDNTVNIGGQYLWYMDMEHIEVQVNKWEHIITDLLKGNYEVMHDYDKENFEEALETGDTELLEDIIGDRDITEFV